MMTVTFSAGTIFALGVVAGIIVGVVGIAIIALANAKRKK